MQNSTSSVPNATDPYVVAQCRCAFGAFYSFSKEHTHFAKSHITLNRVIWNTYSQGWTKAFKTWSPITAGSPISHTNLTVFLWWFKCMCVCVFSPQLFKGKFFICQGEDIRNITNKSDCLQASYKWVRHKYNFDNLGQVRHSKCQDSWWTDAWIKKTDDADHVFQRFLTLVRVYVSTLSSFLRPWCLSLCWRQKMDGSTLCTMGLMLWELTNR